MKKLLYISILVSILSCNKEKYFDGPEFYSDGFENYATFGAMLSDDDLH